MDSLFPALCKKVATYLTKNFSISTAEARRVSEGSISQWGKMRISDGGDTVRVCTLDSSSGHKSGRDATYVKVRILSIQRFHSLMFV